MLIGKNLLSSGSEKFKSNTYHYSWTYPAFGFGLNFAVKCKIFEGSRYYSLTILRFRSTELSGVLCFEIEAAGLMNTSLSILPVPSNPCSVPPF